MKPQDNIFDVLDGISDWFRRCSSVVEIFEVYTFPMSLYLQSTYLLPLPVNYDGRTLREVDEQLEEGTTEVIVYDGSFAYPNVAIDATRVIRSNCIAARPSLAFVERPLPLWKQFLYKTWNDSFSSALNLVVTHDFGEDGWYRWIRVVLVYVSSFILYFIDRITQIYASVYPFALLESEEQVEIFTRCLDWKRGLIRAFKWHPNASKCAVVLTNDDVLIYSSNDSAVPLLRYPNQKKVVEVCWKEDNHDVVVVVCDSVIIIWKFAAGDIKEKARVPLSCARVVKGTDDLTMPVPLTSAAFDPSGDRLFICSPTTSKIVMWKDPSTIIRPFSIDDHFINPTIGDSKDRVMEEAITYIRKYGQGVFRLIWCPDKVKFLTLPTSNYFRIFERISYSHREWKIPTGDVVQAAVWSKPKGRFLLFAGRGACSVYALSFYDSASSGHVGGEREPFEVLNLSEYRLPNGKLVGGPIQDMVWDRHSERLAISFRDNPSFIAVFKTNTKTILIIEPLGFIHGKEGEHVLSMDFHDNFSRGSLLTVAWSSGILSHIPFQYEPAAKKPKLHSMASTSTPVTLRSLTTLCQSPLASPIVSPVQRRISSPNRSNIHSSTSKHMLASDSVISPRKPPLFSVMKDK